MESQTNQSVDISQRETQLGITDLVSDDRFPPVQQLVNQKQTRIITEQDFDEEEEILKQEFKQNHHRRDPSRDYLAPFLAYREKVASWQESQPEFDDDLSPSSSVRERQQTWNRENSEEIQQFLRLERKNTFELIEEYNDDWPVLAVRKAIRRILFGISYAWKVIISQPIFEAFIILVIIANTITLALEDPTVESQEHWIEVMENVFLFIYTAECILKIFGLGFVMRKGSYLRYSWNILDFTIVVTGWVVYLSDGGVNLSALRSLRILRPLRSISSIKQLKVLFLSLVRAIPLLKDTLIILVFFFMIFAIAGLQLWMGILKFRCMDLETGIYGGITEICGFRTCDGDEECVDTWRNPNYGMTNFDNILYSFLAVFQWVTLEGWTEIMVSLAKAFSPWVILYFVPLVFIGAFFLVNLNLAVIKKSFNEQFEKEHQKQEYGELSESEYSYSNDFEQISDRVRPGYAPIASESLSSPFKESWLNTDQFSMENVGTQSEQKQNYLDKIQKEFFLIDSPRQLKMWGHAKIQPLVVDNFGKALHGRENTIVPGQKVIDTDLRHEAIAHLPISTIGQGTYILENTPSYTISEPDEEDQANSGNVSMIDLGSDEAEQPPPQPTLSILEKNSRVQEAGKDIESRPNEWLRFIKGKRSFVVGAQPEIEKYRISVINDIQLEMTSMLDVLPPRDDTNIFQKEGLLRYPEFEFEYKPVEPEQDKKDPRDLWVVFNLLSAQIGDQEAYGKVVCLAKDRVKECHEQDECTNRILGDWSGYEIYPKDIDQSIYMSEVSGSDFRLWAPSMYGYLQKAQYPLYQFVESKWFNHIMTLCVIINTIVLALDHHGISEDMETNLQDMNFAFTIIFAIEMGLKLLGLGVKGYCKDNMNYLDALVVIISIVEVIFLEGSTSAISAFRTIRIFRTFRVLRVARLFRYMTSMTKIIKTISSSLTEFMYLALLLLLFILIFALLGMQIFGGKFDFPEGKPRANFDTFHDAFVTIFQVLSVENWNLVMYDGMRSDAGMGSSMFFIVWIFIGNFALLNLFLAILLDRMQTITNSSNETQQSEESESLNTFEKQVSMIIPNDSKKASKRMVKQAQALIDLAVPDDESDSELDKVVVMKKTTESTTYSEIDCEKAYWLLKKDNPFRVICNRVANSNKFENLILLLICTSSLKLVWDTYIIEDPQDSTEVKISSALDIIFTWLFTLELIIKATSMGFVMDAGSYLRESWNQLDFTIVIVSWVELLVAGVEIPVIKILRLLRTLRPLRFISHNVTMKIVVIALLESIGAIINVMIVVILVWLMFAILGVSLFGGKFYKCEDDAYTNKDDWEDAGFEWENTDFHFDNVIAGFLTLFIVSSLEGWPTIMYSAVDITDVNQAPIENNSPWAAVYFVVFIFIGSFFFLNLFIAVVFDKFNQSRQNEEATKVYLSKEQQYWVEIQKLIPKSKPELDISKVPINWFRKLCYDVCKHDYFEIFILICIIFNIIQMAIIYDSASEDYEKTLEDINLGFTLIFLLEALIKMTGLGPKAYFHVDWNKFDFFVVMASLIDLFLSLFIDNAVTFLRVGPQLIRVIRVLRVSRIFRLIKSLEGIQSLVQTMMYSLPSILNILSLLLLVFFIYSILGVFILHTVKSGEVLDEYTNFNNFGMAMMTLLRIATGEDWHLIMHDYMTDIPESPYYFLSFVTITTFIMMNMFIMVIIQQFDDHYNNLESPIYKYKQDLKHFKSLWAKYSGIWHGWKISQQALVDFLQKLGPPMGIAKGHKLKMVQDVARMDLIIDETNYWYFHDVLYKCLRKVYHPIPKYRSEKEFEKLTSKLVRKAEIDTKMKIRKIIAKFRRKLGASIYAENRQEFISNSMEKSNPIFQLMMMRTIIKSWSKYTKCKKEGRIYGQAESGTYLLQQTDKSGDDRSVYMDSEREVQNLLEPKPTPAIRPVTSPSKMRKQIY